MSDNVDVLKKTPLYTKHLEAGARMVPFSGWLMPVQYTSIISEHIHTRTKAGLFDICHMGEFFIKGEGAENDLNRILTCRVDDMPDGKCRYGFLLNERGGIIDDLIVFKIAEKEYMLVVNAGTVSKDRAWIESNLSRDTIFIDDSENVAKLDIQGPLSGEIIEKLVSEEVVSGIKRFSFVEAEIQGFKMLVSRTGYTGELGYELFIPAEHAEKLWDILTGFEEVRPVGLGARDTLRLEKGYSLYGRDIDEDHTPFESNLSKFVCMDKDFIGKEKLTRQKKEGYEYLLAGFLCEGRRSARSHYKVSAGGKEVGEVTSGAFSPSLKRGIGLCYIQKDLARDNQQVVVTDGRVEISAAIKSLPIY